MPDTPVICLVDDDSDFLEMEKSIFESRGWRVRCYTDPAAALAGLTQETPSLVVTDLMMRALDSGFSLARAVKSDPGLAGVPVIIVSAVSSQKGFDFHPKTPADLAAMHADAFFDKPVSPAALLSKAEELLR
ncbi:MAG TPA: response regulator [Spirochaetia bacterium]|nr:response regulator [Spirochaetia bacterium]